MSKLALFIAMLASPLSIMMLTVPLSSIYNTYISLGEIYQMQLAMPENVRYLVYDNTECNDKLQKQETNDVTEEINGKLKYLGISRQLQEELDRRNNNSE